MAKSCLEWFEITFGLAKIGAVHVAVNWRLAPVEMQQIIEDSQAQVVLVGLELFEAIEAVEKDLTPYWEGIDRRI